jgi:hypothetical protein
MSQLAYTNLTDGTIPVANEFNTRFLLAINLLNNGIETDNIGDSQVTPSKLNINSTFTTAKGADVASAAGTITLGSDGNYFDITGTAAITSITAKTAGTVVILQFDSTASLVDGSNLKINGNFQGAAEAQIALVSDGTNWFELCRSNAGSVAAASQAQMESASATDVYVSPGRTQYHPGMAKAWALWNGATTGTNAPTAGYGVSTIERVGTGIYNITFSTAFSSTSYAVFGSTDYKSNNSNKINITTITSTTVCQVTVTNSANNVVDLDRVYILAYGDQ